MPRLKEKLAKAKSKLAAPSEKLKDHPASLNDYQEGSFYNVPIDLIISNPEQPRKSFDPNSLSGLAQSIKQKGVLQPIIIRKNNDNKIYLVAGERRFRAAKMAGLEKIPAIITKGEPMEISIIENLQRDDLKPIEEAEALFLLQKEHNYTQEQLASVIGKTQSTISETLSLNRLPEQIKTKCRRNNNYSRRLLIEVAKQKKEEKMINLFNQIKTYNLKSGQVRAITRKRKPPRKRTLTVIVLEKMINLGNYLTKLNFDKIEKDKEKHKLITELKTLKKNIEEILRLSACR